MGIGCGYGSECHLLRYMGRHREYLNETVSECTGASRVRWLDFGFRPKKDEGDWPDVEIRGLDFLREDNPARREWEESYWPQTGNVQNWDAVGQVTVNGNDEWLLVEAKAHLGELKVDWGAKSVRGVSMIEAAIENTKRALGVAQDRDWRRGYYQYCNRLIALHFLNRHEEPAHLLFIYFYGDIRSDEADCPSDIDGWTDELEAQDRHVGLPSDHYLRDRIHNLYLPVARPYS